MTGIALRPGEVRVWSVATEDGAAAARTDADDVLSSSERGRAGRMPDDGGRRDYVIAHLLVRHALSNSVPGVAAHEWQFLSDEAGRPEVVGRSGDPDVRFSLSHADGIVACAVTIDTDCGVDVEPIGATQPRRRVFTPEETALLDEAGPEAAADLYARLWTVKEAYGKARGLGLLLPFDRLHVTLGTSPRLDDSTRPPTDGGWYVEQWRPTRRHVAALAVIGPRPVVVHASGFPD